MILETEYTFWGDHGKCYHTGLDEFQDVAQAILEIGQVAFYTAINEEVKILRVIGADTHVIQEVEQGVKAYVKKRQHDEKVKSVKGAILSHQNWLDSVSTETIRRSQEILQLKKELRELEEEQ